MRIAGSLVRESPSNFPDPEYARFAYYTTTAAGPCKRTQPMRYQKQWLFGTTTWPLYLTEALKI